MDLRAWELFEKRIRVDALMSRVTPVKVPQKTQVGIKVKSSVDYCLGVDGRAVFLDAKHTFDSLWNLKEHVFHVKKIHQFGELLNAQANGNKAGYLIHLAKLNKICWAPISAIENARAKDQCSIHPGTEGLVSQSDEEPINFRLLIFGETTNETLRN